MGASLSLPNRLKTSSKQKKPRGHFQETSLVIAHSSFQEKNLVIDKLPPELWDLIFSYLYPSHLAKLSQVNRHFYHLATNLCLWETIYYQAFPYKPLQLLPHIPPLSSYALFLAANSLQICEQCFCRTGTIIDDTTTTTTTTTDSYTGQEPGQGQEQGSYEQQFLGTASMPLPVFLPWAKSMIRLCLVCRRKHFYAFPEPIPVSMTGKRWRKKQIRTRLHLRNEEIEQLKRYGCGPGRFSFCAEDALTTARIFYGGDVGVAAVNQSPTELMDRSISRMNVYQKRRETLNACGLHDNIASLVA
ncbi:hypothetical protein BGZ65_003487 [Modicella reniformis]|uniref:F-box domain-containing protein n=1 Tax=Modicella reniformis TaxID=1440133 RepID=A0A9P6J655_9FUNG|nr:hypothetical protein BGZ65_003487 [Modicella reniformis]